MIAEAQLDVPALPEVFLRYQQKLMATVSRFAVTVWEKSRRTGFSWACGAIAALSASSVRAAGGMDVFYIGYNLEMAREFIDYVGEWAKTLSAAASEVGEEFFDDPERPEKQIKAFRINFASGFKVLALPSVPRALRGMQGLVIIDEAAFHDDLDGVLKAAMALLIWGGKVIVISTHDGDTNPFNVLVQDIRAGRLPYQLGRTTLDDALEDGLYERICLVSGQAWSTEAQEAWKAQLVAQYGSNADEELFVIPSAGSGAYLSAALIEKRMADGIPVIRYEPPAGMLMWSESLRLAEVRSFCEAELLPILQSLDAETPHAFGQDFGRKRDLSVFWPLAIGRDLVLRTPFELEMRNVPYEAQRQIIFYIVDRLPRFRAGKFDATGNGGYLAEVCVQRYGERIEAVMLNEPWYRENMPKWRAAFEDGTIVIPRDREIMDDLRLVKLIRGVGRIPDERTGEKDKRRHGDSAVASALAVAAARAKPEEYGYTAAPRVLRAAEGTGRGFYDTAEQDEAAEEDEKANGAAPTVGFMPAFTRRPY